MHNKVRVFRVLRYIFLHCWTNNVYLEVILTGPVESNFCQRGSKTHTTQFLRNFSMDQLQNGFAQTVFKIGDFAVPLDFRSGQSLLSVAVDAYGERVPHGY